MPIKKEYRAKTYGMKPKEYMKLFEKQIKKPKDCKGYKEFLEDVKILKETNNSGMPALLANIWIKRICEMDDEQLFKFVNNYKKGELDPCQFELEYKMLKQKMKKEKIGDSEVE